MFIVLIWSIGAILNTKDSKLFNKFVSNLFVNIRPPGSLYDFYVDINKKSWINWNTIVPKFNYNKDIPYFQMLVPTTDTIKYTTLLKTLIKIKKAIFFTGVTGVGKSVIIQSIFQQSDTNHDDNLINIPISFSAQTQAKQVQLTIENKLISYKQNVLGVAKNKLGLNIY